MRIKARNIKKSLRVNLSLGKAEKHLSDVAATTENIFLVIFQSSCIEDGIIVWRTVSGHFMNTVSVSFACLLESH